MSSQDGKGKDIVGEIASRIGRAFEETIHRAFTILCISLTAYEAIVLASLTFILYKFFWPLEIASWIKWSVSAVLYIVFGVVTPLVLLALKSSNGNGK